MTWGGEFVGLLRLKKAVFSFTIQPRPVGTCSLFSPLFRLLSLPLSLSRSFHLFFHFFRFICLKSNG